jgi:putative transcriptional regulator
MLRTKSDAKRSARARQPRSEAARFIHEAMGDLHAAGFLPERTMRRFDASCLAPVEHYSSREIAKLRRREGVSQPVFAVYLNVSAKTIAKWERGESKPDGASLKLLNVVDKKGLGVLA